MCFQHHACFSIAIKLAKIWFVLKIPPNYWKQWLVLRRNEKMSCQGQSHSLVLTKDKRDKGAAGICGKNCRHLPKCEIWQSCIDICVKNIGQISSAPKLYCSWKLWAKVNYKQLHLATKSIWGFNPILEQIAWKCKIDCLLELEGEEGEGRDIKISKFRWCTIPQWSRLHPQNQCNLFVILSGFSLKFHL